MWATGTLKPAWEMGEKRTGAIRAAPSMEAFGFDELPAVVSVVDGGEFRDAAVSGDTLTVWIGADNTEISLAPPVDAQRTA